MEIKPKSNVQRVQSPFSPGTGDTLSGTALRLQETGYRIVMMSCKSLCRNANMVAPPRCVVLSALTLIYGEFPIMVSARSLTAQS